MASSSGTFRKPSKQPAVCFYCHKTVRRDRLKAHIQIVHGRNTKVKERGQGNISSFFGQPQAKKHKPDLNEETTDMTEETTDPIERDLTSKELDEGDEAQETEETESSETGSASDTDDDDNDQEMPTQLSEDDEGDNEQDLTVPLDAEEPMQEQSDREQKDDAQAETIPPSAPLLDMTRDYPTDPGLFVECSFTPKLVNALINCGPCQPGLNDGFKDFTQSVNAGRKFNPDWYYMNMKSGLRSYREWLMYSPIKHKAFCFYCMLFAQSEHFYPVFADPSHGFNNWKKATSKFQKHEESQIHKDSVRDYIQTKVRLGMGLTVNKEQERAYKREVEHNREVLKRLVDITLFLCRQNLPFRGDKEARFSCLGKVSENEGNFLQLVQLLAKYDSVLAKHISASPKAALYLSPGIQNQFIEALANEVRSKIIKEINEARYFGIILDSTIDIAHTDQLSFSVRYVDQHFVIQERFICFTNIESSGSERLFNELESLLENNQLDIMNIRCQAYDGAANMSGGKTGLQTRVKEKNSNALYVHCMAHNLNLALASTCSSCIEAVTFFGIIQKLYTFITSSQPRLTRFEKAQKDLHQKEIKLQKICETRWYCRHSAVKAVKECYPALLLALERIVKNEKTPVNVAEARGLLQNIQKMEFVLMLEIWEEILSNVNSLSEYLQKVSLDVIAASNMVDATSKCMKENRTDTHFKKLITQAKQMITASNKCFQNAVAQKSIEENEIVHVEPLLEEKRMRTKTTPGATAEDRFRVGVFFSIYDNIHESMVERFSDFQAKVKFFGCLMPTHFNNDMFRELAQIYADDIDVDLSCSQYEQYCILLNNLIENEGMESPNNLQDLLLLFNKFDLHTAYPYVAILYKIFATICVTSATAERSFSKLRIIKNYLRTTMSEDRLSSLAILSIEKEICDQLDFNSVLDTFKTMTKSGQRRWKL